MWSCPPERQDPASSTRTQTPVLPPPGSLHNPLNQPYPLGAAGKNNGNYKPAACKKESQNTVVKQNEKTEKYAADEGSK